MLLCVLSGYASAKEYHVSVNGMDGSYGSVSKPFKTISAAAAVAQPGDTITVHEGIYREQVSPPRGGTSDDNQIVYQAAPGEAVEIRGSEVVKNWTKEAGGVWKTEIPNTLFGKFNPFADEVKGDWFNPRGPKAGVYKDGEWLDDMKENPGGRKHHTGCVYQDGEWLFEAGKKADLFVEAGRFGEQKTDKAWFAEVGEKTTTVYATFGGSNPNESLTEVNVRQTVFYPRKPFLNYITVRGFKMRHAAPPWAPPTAEQMGLIGTHWSKGWIIENNEISHSINVGLSLGKYGDEFDNIGASNEAYLNAIDRAYSNGWNKETIGSHIIRNNEIFYCEQAGIVGSMGASYSKIIGNHIHHIYSQRRFTGAEMAAIKFHASIDMVIEGNCIHDAFLAIWLDWMAQGPRVSRNLLYRNICHDLYFEVNHGPYLVDNNICLSETNRHLSQGGAFVHNFFACKWGNWADSRQTPYFKAHTTEKIADHNLKVGDDRFYNNVFIGNGAKDSLIVVNEHPTIPYYFSFGLRCYEKRPRLPETGGNFYYHGAEPCANEKAVVVADNPQIKLTEEKDGVYLEYTVSPKQKEGKTELVTTELLGKAQVPRQEFTHPDGSPLKIDTDYFGKKRNLNNPSSGPFENPGTGRVTLKVWPVK